MGITDLEEQFTFYASYHHNGWNKVVHIVCVWPILWSAFVLAQYIPFEAPGTALPTLSSVHPLNVTLLTAFLYAGIYILMDKRAGSLGALLVVASLITSRKFYLGFEESYGIPAWQVAAGIQVFSWIAQFVGHGVCEGRAPALLDNLMQAFVMAPLFVLLEVLFFFGYRKDLQKRMSVKVMKEIAKHKAQAKASKQGRKKK